MIRNVFRLSSVVSITHVLYRAVANILLVVAVNAMLRPGIVAAQAPGTGSAVSEVANQNSYVSGTYPCYQYVVSQPASSTTCNPTIAGGITGSASSSSNNALRTVRGAAVMTNLGAQESVGQPYSLGSGSQYSALTVTGTPAPDDQLVFHFLTNQSVSGLGGTADAIAWWQLAVSNATNTADAYQNVYADGTDSTVSLVNAQQTVGGLDVFLPFTSGGTFDYSFGAMGWAGFGGNQPQPPGTTIGASITATLQGIDATTGTGLYISSAVFDAQTGFGAIDVTTTPEPSSLALIAIGLIGVTPCISRRRSGHEYESFHQAFPAVEK